MTRTTQPVLKQSPGAVIDRFNDNTHFWRAFTHFWRSLHHNQLEARHIWRTVGRIELKKATHQPTLTGQSTHTSDTSRSTAQSSNQTNRSSSKFKKLKTERRPYQRTKTDTLQDLDCSTRSQQITHRFRSTRLKLNSGHRTTSTQSNRTSGPAARTIDSHNQSTVPYNNSNDTALNGDRSHCPWSQPILNELEAIIYIALGVQHNLTLEQELEFDSIIHQLAINTTPVFRTALFRSILSNTRPANNHFLYRMLSQPKHEKFRSSKTTKHSVRTSRPVFLFFQFFNTTGTKTSVKRISTSSQFNSNRQFTQNWSALQTNWSQFNRIATHLHKQHVSVLISSKIVSAIVLTTVSATDHTNRRPITQSVFNSTVSHTPTVKTTFYEQFDWSAQSVTSSRFVRSACGGLHHIGLWRHTPHRNWSAPNDQSILLTLENGHRKTTAKHGKQQPPHWANSQSTAINSRRNQSD